MRPAISNAVRWRGRFCCANGGCGVRRCHGGTEACRYSPTRTRTRMWWCSSLAAVWLWCVCSVRACAHTHAQQRHVRRCYRQKRLRRRHALQRALALASLVGALSQCAGALGARHYHRHKRRLCKGSADRFCKVQGCAECPSCWPGRSINISLHCITHCS